MRRRSPRGTVSRGQLRRTAAMSFTSRRAFPCGRPTTLAAGGLLLGGRAALARVSPPNARSGLLASAAGGSRRVRDLRRSLLRHPLFLQGLVLLLVLHAGPLVRHGYLLLARILTFGISFPEPAACIRALHRCPIGRREASVGTAISPDQRRGHCIARDGQHQVREMTEPRGTRGCSPYGGLGTSDGT